MTRVRVEMYGEHGNCLSENVKTKVKDFEVDIREIVRGEPKDFTIEKGDNFKVVKVIKE